MPFEKVHVSMNLENQIKMLGRVDGIPFWFAQPWITFRCHLDVHLIILFDKNKQLRLNKIEHMILLKSEY